MNSKLATPLPASDLLGRQLALRLDETLPTLPHPVRERLRAARVRAVALRASTAVQTAHAAQVQGGGLLAGLWGEHIWWARFAATGLLAALALSLVGVDAWQDDLRTRELAEVDAQLLIDELPPAAYADPGFVQFIKHNTQALR